MKKRIIHIIFTLALCISSLQAVSQTFPVQVIPQVTPPPPVYLSDYANAANTVDKIKATILLTDLTVANRQVRLKLYIEGNGIDAQSRDFVIGAQPIFLDGGIPVQLGTLDLAPYFELQNLQGISAGAYANTLPEGLYQFCFEVYDVLSGNLISRKSCANVLIFLNEPPFLNLPQNNINLEAMNPQNLLFQWTPRHINVTNVEYEFSLVEIWDFTMDPQAVFLASPPIYQTTTQATSFLYGIAEPQLLEGKRYAWRVRAKAKDGIDEIGLFSNNGYSEIFAFTYQGECAEPTYLSVEEVGTKTATFRWQGDIDNLKYRIGYRKATDEDGNTGEANTFEWFENDTNREEYMVIDLEPDTMYEWRLGGYCADGTLTYAPSTTFTTMNVDAEAYYNCGIEPSIDIANQVLIETIQVGDVIKAGDFNVKIQEVEGTNSFTGKGYTTVGFLKNIKIALIFTNIQVNTNYQFVSGEIKTVYDPNWTNILDVDDVIDEFEDIVDVFTGDDIVIITVDYDITTSDINVDTDNGQIVITNPDTGETATYDYDDGDTYTITDESGDRFNIDKEGNVTQTGTGAEGGAATAANTVGITDNQSGNVGAPSVRNIEKHPITFVYKTQSDTKYGLDKANNDYENEKYHKVTIEGGGSYYPIHKAIVEGGAVDNFYVDVVNSSNYINTDSLIFKTVAGTKVPAVKVPNTNTYKITLTGRNSYVNEEAIITYKDTVGKQHVLSSFFIHHIKKFPTINVNVVLVNGASNVDGLQAKLDAIYKPTGVSFTVNTTADEITIPKAEWDVDISNNQIDYNGSGLASDHPKELRVIKNYYKDQRPDFDSKAYYLFVIDDSMPITKALAGFMPKKNQWGFLFESQDNNTNIQKKEDLSTVAAHELGHGVFALGHPFGEDETQHGNANTWLMDYSNGTELAYPNWAKMSSDKLQLYLFQDDEGNEMASLNFIGFEDVGITYSTTQNKPSFPDCYNFNMFNNQTSISFEDKYKSIITKYHIDPNKHLKKIDIGDNNLGKMIGTYKNARTIETDENDIVIKTSNRLSFTCYECIDREIENNNETTITKGKAIENGKEIEYYSGITSSSKYVITVNKLDCNSQTNVVYGFNENDEGLCVNAGCSTSNDVRCAQMNYDLEVTNDVKNAISEHLKSAITRIDVSKKKIERPLKKFNHIFVVNGGQSGMSNEQQEWEILEDKFHLLSYEKNDTYFVLGLVKNQNNSLYTSEQLKEIATNAIENNDQDNTKKIVLVLINSSNFESILGETSTVCTNLGFAESSSGITDSKYITSTGKSVKDVMSIYSSIAKPLIVNKYYQYANGTLQNYLLKSKQDERGYPFIKTLKFYQSNAYKSALSMRSNCTTKDTRCQGDCADNDGGCYLACSNEFKNCKQSVVNFIEDQLEIEYSKNALMNMSLWTEMDVNKLGRFREIYMDFDGSNSLTDSQNNINETENVTLELYMQSVDKWGWGSKFEIATNWNTELKAKYFYDFSKLKVLDDVVYGTLDVVGLIPGLDTFTDPIGAIYAGIRGDTTNAMIYSASFAIPFAGAAYIKGGAKASKKLDEMYGIVAKKANNADGFDLYYTRLDNIPAEHYHVTSIIHSVDDKMTRKIALDDVKKYADKSLVKSKVDELAINLAKLDEWIDGLTTLSQSQKALFKADINTSNSLKTLFAQTDQVVKRDEIADAWRLLHSANPQRSGLKLKGDAIEALSKIRKNSSKDALGITDEILVSLKGAEGLSYKEIVKNLDQFSSKVAEKKITLQNFNKVLDQLKQGDGKSDGANWIVKYLGKNSQDFSNKTLKFEDYMNNSLGGRYVDVSDLTNEVRAVFYEFKSVKGVPPKDFKEQLMKDLTNADDLDQIKWIFNANKNPLGNSGKSFRDTLIEEIDKLPLTEDLAEKFIGQRDILEFSAYLKESFDDLFLLAN